MWARKKTSLRHDRGERTLHPLPESKAPVATTRSSVASRRGIWISQRGTPGGHCSHPRLRCRSALEPGRQLPLAPPSGWGWSTGPEERAHHSCLWSEMLPAMESWNPRPSSRPALLMRSQEEVSKEKKKSQCSAWGSHTLSLSLDSSEQDLGENPTQNWNRELLETPISFPLRAEQGRRRWGTMGGRRRKRRNPTRMGVTSSRSKRSSRIAHA